MTTATTDLATLRDALQSDPTDSVTWAAYGDCFEERYGHAARAVLACRRVRLGINPAKYTESAGKLRDDLTATLGPNCEGLACLLRLAGRGFSFPAVEFRLGLVKEVWAVTPGGLFLVDRALLRLLGGQPLTAVGFQYANLRECLWAGDHARRWGFHLDNLPGEILSAWPAAMAAPEDRHVAFPSRKAAKRALGLAVINALRLRAKTPPPARSAT